MDNQSLLLRKKIRDMISHWDKSSVKPSWTELYAEGKKLLSWKNSRGIKSIWSESPLLITATLDDGLGNGLKLIHLYSEIAGIDYIHAGLMMTAEEIIEECIKKEPDILGLTILRSDMDEEFEEICRNIPEKTRIVAGGSIINSDPGFGECERGYFPAENALSFIKYLMDFNYE